MVLSRKLTYVKSESWWPLDIRGVDEMAEKSNGGVRFDDFVGRVHADPAKVEPRTLLSGFVGRGAEDGKLRIYSDPSLGSWVEASAEDVVHTQPIDNSPLGGSHVWLKSGATLTPGSAQGTGGAAGAAAVGGLGADVGVFNPTGTIHPTLWTQIGCPTHQAWCPPHASVATICTQFPPCAPIHTHEFFCPPRTLAVTICGGPIHTVICPPQTLICPTHNPAVCPVATGVFCPSTLSCPIGGPVELPQAHAFAAAAPPTHMLGCPATQTCTPTFYPACLPSSTPACLPPTHNPGCPNTSTCTPTHHYGCPGSSTCPPSHSPACAATIPPPSATPACLPPTHMLGCPSTSTCTPTHIPGCGGGGIHTLIGCFPTLAPACPVTAPPFCPATIGCPR